MPTSLLERKMGNDLFEAMRALGVDPSQFEELDRSRESNGRQIRFRLRARSYEARFAIDNTIGTNVHVITSTVPDERPVRETLFDWPTVLGRFRDWLADVKEYIETPDWWAELRQEVELLRSFSDNEDNTPFSPAEREYLVTQLEQVRQRAKSEPSLSEEQVKSLDTKIDYLEDAVGRLGRTDWRAVFIGAITSWMFGDAIPPDTARRILGMVAQGVRHLLRARYPDLPIP